MPESAGEIVSSIGTAVVSTAAAVGISYGVQAITGGRDKSSNFRDVGNEAKGRSVMIRASIEPHRIIYGEVLTSGPILFWTVSGSGNEYLHIVVALAGHEVNAIGDVYLDDILATDAKYSSIVRINKHLGSASQTVDTDLTAEVPAWTSAHRLRGIAYVYARLTYDNTAWSNGIPNIRAVVQGRKVYDPRTATTTYSANAALCQRDYLTADFGIGAVTAELNEDTWIAAANICDEDVTLAAGGTEKRYTCNGSFQRDMRPIDVMTDLLSASAGTCIFSQGQWCGFAGAYSTPLASPTLNEDDLRGELHVVSRPSRRDLFNSVRGNYVDKTNYWQGADFPPWEDATYKSEDGGVTLYRDIELPFTTSSPTAQRLAKLTLEKHRLATTVDFPAKLTALPIRCMDNITVSIGYLGWTNEVFRVARWALAEDGGVDLTLKADASTAYAWSAEEQTPATAPDAVGEAGLDPPQNLRAVVSYVVSPEQNPLILFIWDQTTDQRIINGGQIVFWYASAGGSDWAPLANGPGGGYASYVYFPGPWGAGYAYDFCARFEANGMGSAWSYVKGVQSPAYGTAGAYSNDQSTVALSETGSKAVI